MRENVHLRIGSTQHYLFTHCTRVADSNVHKIIYIMYIRPILYKQVPFMSTISCLSFFSSKIILLYFICTSLSFLSKKKKLFVENHSEIRTQSNQEKLLWKVSCLIFNKDVWILSTIKEEPGHTPGMIQTEEYMSHLWGAAATELRSKATLSAVLKTLDTVLPSLLISFQETPGNWIFMLNLLIFTFWQLFQNTIQATQSKSVCYIWFRVH